LSNLQELILSDNQLTGNIPLQFSKLKKLSTLMLSDNNMDINYATVVDDKRAIKKTLTTYNDTYVVERD